ncbi:MAG TPA: ABC transporter permease, partial [Rhodothermales bacterium]|nr:ABC transporter permease [Rhodothermales bacterium]
MRKSIHDRPPRLAAFLLDWLLKDDWHTPLGDFEEYYHELAAERGRWWARWWYRGQVAWLLPDRLYQKSYWGLLMLKNYAKLAYRNLLKNKVASFINVFGLSIAIACSIVVYLFLQNYLSLDSFHENGDRIFVVQHTVERDGQQQRWGTAPAPMGPVLAAAFPQVERAVRLATQGGFVQHGENVFDEYLSFADDGFLDMFTFPLQQGTPEALADPSAVILSDEAARRYFGEDDPLGQQITITFGNDQVETFTVGGVAAPFPDNAAMRFNVLLRYDKQLTAGTESLEDWSTFTDATFIQVTNPQDIDALAGQMRQYVAMQNAVNEDWAVTSFFFDNLKHPASDAYLVQDRFSEAPHPLFILMLAAIPIGMLALSCFNYVNISLGSASRRLREIGVRKVMGSTRRQLIGQFMAENLLLCFLSLLLGLIVAQAFLVPLFNVIFVNLIDLSLTKNLGLWLFLVGLLAFIGLASGAYPAFYISAFQPVTVLRGKQRLANKKGLTRAFLTFQFTLAFVTVFIGVYLTMNGRYILNQDWGYTAEHTLVVRLNNSNQYELLQNEALQLAAVKQVAGSQHQVGESVNHLMIEVEGKQKEAFQHIVGPGYFDAIGLRLVAGHLFDEQVNSDVAHAVVITEAFARRQGWEEPLGQTLRVEGTTYAVVGVVENFLLHPMIEDPSAFFLQSEDAPYRYLSMRVEAGAGAQTAAAMEATWKRLFPGTPFEHFFQDEVFDIHYQSYTNLTQAFSYIAALALLIACMGLFGLASQNMARRMKEVSIRKVLGASVAHITVLVNRSFLTMLAVAGVLATLVCYGGLAMIFQFASQATNMGIIHLPLHPGLFLLTYALVFVTAALSVAMQ